VATNYTNGTNEIQLKTNGVPVHGALRAAGEKKNTGIGRGKAKGTVGKRLATNYTNCTNEIQLKTNGLPARSACGWARIEITSTY